MTLFSAVPLPSTPRSVLVITKHNFMGDTVVATPLLRAARRVYPSAVITLLTGRAASVLLREFPCVDQIIPYDPRRKLLDALRLARDLRRSVRPDICLLADRSLRSAVIARLCGAPVRVGFDTEGRGGLLTHRVFWDKDRWEAECFLDVLRAVAPERDGEPPYDPYPRLFVTDAERERGAQMLREHEAVGPPLVGIQPGATYLKKQWATERFAEVARGLSADGATIVLVGGAEEVETARTLRSLVRESVPVVDLTGTTASLREMMGVLTNLSLFIGNDTGVTHTAAALSVPTVSLFGPTRAMKWGERGPKNAVLAAPDGDLTRLDASLVLAAARLLLCSVRNGEAPPPRASLAESSGDTAASLAVGSERR